jgi:hypothetical protein
MSPRGDNGRVNPHTVKKVPVVRMLWACGTNMSLPGARLVPCLPDASRKDQKQVGVGPGVIGDFDLVAKGYTVSLALGVDMVWSMRLETGREKGEQRGKEGLRKLDCFDTLCIVIAWAGCPNGSLHSWLCRNRTS